MNKIQIYNNIHYPSTIKTIPNMFNIITPNQSTITT